MPDDPKTGAWWSKNRYLTIPKLVPDDRQAPFLGYFLRSQFWDRQAAVLGLSGTSFGISRLFLGYKKELKLCSKGCFRVFKGVLDLPYVNICYTSSHSNHVNHPFNVKLVYNSSLPHQWFQTMPNISKTIFLAKIKNKTNICKNIPIRSGLA